MKGRRHSKRSVAERNRLETLRTPKAIAFLIRRRNEYNSMVLDYSGLIKHKGEIKCQQKK